MKKEDCKILDKVKIKFQDGSKTYYKEGTILDMSDKRADVKFEEFEIIMYVDYDRLEPLNSKFF